MIPVLQGTMQQLADLGVFSIFRPPPFCHICLGDGAMFWSRRQMVVDGVQKYMQVVNAIPAEQRAPCDMPPMVVVLSSQAQYLFCIEHDGCA